MKLNIFLTIVGLQFLFISCLKEDTTTLVLPKVVHISPIEEVIPTTVLQKMDNYMPIYKGSTPPNIEGSYKVSSEVLVYSSDGQFTVGDVFADSFIRFSSQNSVTQVLNYNIKQGSSTASSEQVAVTGSGNDFTAYFISTGQSYDIYTKTATIITGTKTSSGITSFYYSFVMLEKGLDTDDQLMDINEFRVFKDLDGTAVNYSWTKSGSVSDKKELLDVHSASKFSK